MSYRQGVMILCISLLLFVGGNYLVWTVWTEGLLTDKLGGGGDLARMGYVYGAKMPRKNHTDLPLQHIEWTDYQGGSVEMITVGDSYSYGGGGGKNRYYQDYIASINKLRVLHLPALIKPGGDNETTQMETVIKLANSGWLRERGVRYVLLQSIEWMSVERFAHKFDFLLSEDKAVLNGFFTDYRRKADLPDVSFINEGNLKFLLQPLSYRFTGHDFNRKVYISKLDREMFSVKRGNELLFFRNNITSTPRFSDADVKAINDNLNSLAELLDKQGVLLIFMPCVDKYNLYSDYLVNNRYPKSSFFEKLRPLPKQYRFIDTKSILAEGVAAGVKDIYFSDDTHWSWKASEMIFAVEKF